MGHRTTGAHGDLGQGSDFTSVCLVRKQDSNGTHVVRL